MVIKPVSRNMANMVKTELIIRILMNRVYSRIIPEINISMKRFIIHLR